MSHVSGGSIEGGGVTQEHPERAERAAYGPY